MDHNVLFIENYDEYVRIYESVSVLWYNFAKQYVLAKVSIRHLYIVDCWTFCSSKYLCLSLYASFL